MQQRARSDCHADAAVRIVRRGQQKSVVSAFVKKTQAG
ncbi:hypothetical protein B0G73_107160 [Paraburkholderia sp. BL25I1N1]|nr:hypothetical protein B0G73_107160 [Paraburkholderia sp. BL25I1N1]